MSKDLEQARRMLAVTLSVTANTIAEARDALQREDEHAPSFLRKRFPDLSWVTIGEIIRIAAGETGPEYDVFYQEAEHVLEKMDREVAS